MGEKYRHIQPEDRITIHKLLFQGYAIVDIAKAINVHRSTLCRATNIYLAPSRQDSLDDVSDEGGSSYRAMLSYESH